MMEWQYTPYIVPVLTGALITTILSGYAWQRRRATSALPFAGLMLAVTGWSLGYVVALGGREYDTLLFGNYLAYTGITAVPFFWYWFTQEYTQREARPERNNLILIAIVPVANLLLLWTNELHGLVWRDVSTVEFRSLLLLDLSARGLWFWLYLFFTYGLMLAGTVVLTLHVYRRSPFLYRDQPIALALGIIIPWLGNGIHLLEWSVLDPTPFAFAIGGLLVAWDIFRSRAFEVMPVAHNTVWQQMRDGLLLLDRQHKIVELNPAAEVILECERSEAVGQPLVGVTPALADTIIAYLANPAPETTIAQVREERHRFYELQTSTFSNRLGQIAGYLLVMRNVTGRTRAEEALRTQKQLFESLVALAPATTAQSALRTGLHNTLCRIMDLTKAQGGYLVLTDTEVTGEAILWPDQLREEHEGYFPAQLRHQDIVDWVIRHGETAHIDDVNKDDRTAGSSQTRKRAVLAVPIQRDTSNLLGVICFQHVQPGHFTATHVELVQVAANQIGLVLNSAQMLRQQQLLSNRQIITYKLLRTVGELLEPTQVAYTAVETVAELTGWSTVAIYMPDNTQGRLVIQAAVGLLSVDEGVNGRAYRTGQTQIFPDPDLHQQLPVDFTALAVPLRQSRRTIGVFNVEVDRPQGFAADDILLAESLAEAIALVLENARLFQAVSQEQSRLKALIEANRDGIVMISVNGRILVINRPALSMLRLEGDPFDWVNHSLATALRRLRRYAPAAVQATVAEFRRIRTGRLSAAEGEFKVGIRSLSWRSLPVQDGKKPLGRLLILRDVTEERLVEQMRDDLIHTMVHDLRGPLTSISVSLHLLNVYAEANEDERSADTLLRARKSMEMVLELVNAILDISRLESGRMLLDREEISFGDLVADVLDWQLPLIEAKRQQLEMELAPDLPPVWVDAELMQRVLQNLIGNANKFTPPGGTIAVRATATAVTPDSGHLLVSIHDTGPGISTPLKERLFQKFAKEGNESGSGLGLYFCRMVLEAHGEKIWIEDTDEGTLFQFTLPLFEKTGSNT